MLLLRSDRSGRVPPSDPVLLFFPIPFLLLRPFMPTARITFVLAALSFCSAVTLTSSQGLADVYEMRTYVAAEGKLDALNARFRDHTVRLFEKHGIESIGYWVPTDEETSKNTLIYIIKHKSRDAANESWKAFLADPQWQEAAAASGVGKLASKPESVYLEATDYSPTWDTTSENSQADEDDVFELRIYKAAPGKLGKLDARFRDHTIRLFDRHGIKSVGYWHPTDEPAASDTLVYVLKHNSADAAKASWKAFGADPEWKAAAQASDVGPLAERPTVIYMRATDYSQIR